jgi:hypothetical protein
MTIINNRVFIIAHLIELAHPLAMVGIKANINHKLIHFKLWKCLYYKTISCTNILFTVLSFDLHFNLCNNHNHFDAPFSSFKGLKDELLKGNIKKKVKKKIQNTFLNSLH